jgi:hypothetical protein
VSAICLDGFGFEQTFSPELGVELGAVLLIRGEIVFGQNHGLAGQAVTESVERRSALALFGARAGGESGVAAVDGGSRFLRGRGGGCEWVHENTSSLFSRGGGGEGEGQTWMFWKKWEFEYWRERHWTNHFHPEAQGSPAA